MLKAFYWWFHLLVFLSILMPTSSINHPVILIPGDGGSQVNARLNKESVVHYICQKKTKDFFNLWLNIELLVPLVIDCWVDNMSLRYNNETRTTENAKGVEIEIPGFGTSSVVEWIDPSKASPGAYFKDIANFLVSVGYVRDLSLRGAPYDFRKGPILHSHFSNPYQCRSICIGGFEVIWLSVMPTGHESYQKTKSRGVKCDVNIRRHHASPKELYERGVTIDPVSALPDENREYFLKLISLIEETYVANGNKSVILIAHSMGGPMAHILLQKVNQDWKDKYVRALVGLSGAWGGSVKALKVYAVGDNLGAFMLRQSIVKAEQISSPSLAWLLPWGLFWKPNEVLVETSNKNYTVKDFQSFFTDIEFETGWEMYKDVLPYRDRFPAPGVEVHCLHGYGVETTEKLLYKAREFPLGNPELISGDGDGTVNRRSLEACLHWQGLQKKKVFHQAFPKVDHMEVLRNKNILSYLSEMLKNV